MKLFIILAAFILIKYPVDGSNKTVVGDLGYQRVAGGQIATGGQFPYHVAISENKAYICGGTIVHLLYIITVIMIF